MCGLFFATMNGNHRLDGQTLRLMMDALRKASCYLCFKIFAIFLSLIAMLSLCGFVQCFCDAQAEDPELARTYDSMETHDKIKFQQATICIDTSIRK